MDHLHRPTRWLAVCVAAALTCACYSHAGQPMEADDETWRQQAREACQRGDRAAFEALVERADLEDRHWRCDPPTVEEHTSCDRRD